MKKEVDFNYICETKINSFVGFLSMISSKLQQHYIRKELQKLSFDTQIRNRATSTQKIQSVGILTEEHFLMSIDLQQEIEHQFEIEKSKMISFRKFHKRHEPSDEFFSEKDFDWKGKIIDPNLESFLNQSFDLLICYYSKPHTLLNYTTMLSKADFKVGFAGVNFNLFDLEIAIDSDHHKLFLTEVGKYLKVLGKL
jgi:hypothetical protein